MRKSVVNCRARSASRLFGSGSSEPFWGQQVFHRLEPSLPSLILPGVLEKLAVFAFHFDRSALCALSLDAHQMVVQHTRIKGPPIGRYGPHRSSIGAMTMARMRHNRPFVAVGQRVRFPWLLQTFADPDRHYKDVRSPHGLADALLTGADTRVRSEKPRFSPTVGISCQGRYKVRARAPRSKRRPLSWRARTPAVG
ncbi:hypothetical+protein [Methylocapsa aurea]